MGLRGPAKRPSYLKVLSGTASLDAKPDVSPIPEDQALTELPAGPDWLPNQIARDEWAKVGAELLKRGLLDSGRLMTLGIYCATAGKIAQKFGAGDVPAAHLIAQHKSLGKELGLIGQSASREPIEKPAAKGRLASIKERSQRTD